jgi:isopenicillin N synthase-like dioxygenase
MSPHRTDSPTLDHFTPVKRTTEDLPYADLVTLDFSNYENGPEARQELAEQLNHAMRTQGFFIIINHGVSEETIDRHVDIAHQ